MNAYVLAALIAVSVFLLVIAGFFLGRYLLRNRRRKTVYTPSFERADKGKIRDTEQLRRSASLKDRSTKEGRGRFYAFGVLIAAIFGTLAVKLWSLQVLGHDKYVALSNENMTSEVFVPANRGRILDRNGNELVGNRPSITVTGKRSLAEDAQLVQRLSLVLGVPRGIIRKNLLDDTEGVQSDHTIATDVPMKSVGYIREHPTLFEGINVESRTVRYYPYGSLAAHVLGYTGPVTEDFLKSQTGNEPIPYHSGDIIGKDGAELTFEKILQGMAGTKTYKVDASGNPSEVIAQTEPVNGDDVALTIDANLQRETDQILIDVISAARSTGGHSDCNAGALICLDIEDGGILAASSYPTFFPAELSRGISTDLWAELNSEQSGYPLTNRVISGLYPAASTFKAFTSMAGLQNGIVVDDTQHYCNGYWDEYGEQWGQRCWIYPRGHGTVGLEEAINVSCDIFFYSVGAAFYERWYALPEVDIERPNAFQDYIKTWGFGTQTGVDMPGEALGRIPDAAWKQQAFSDTPEEAMWVPGDMTNMCIGQGDILVTPLQLCNGYCTVARRKIVTPHVFYRVTDATGAVVVSYENKEVASQPIIEPAYADRVVEGLKRVAIRETAFNRVPVELAAKSGTAEVAGKDDYSWFVAYGPVESPKYCVACVIEQGGGGSSAAINGVAQTFARLYDTDIGQITVYRETGER
ncbi:MAG: penicillin-binding protein 2 [Coriobacteriales bacterium]|jgi:penicillin-binding protein 2|nr:penicillin-binding protein 2 [Coriobacteriales bacterium]